MSVILTYPTYLIFGAIVASFVLSIIAESIVTKGALMLTPAVRESIAIRCEGTSKIFRMLGILGFMVLLAGMARHYGFIKGKASMPWGLYCIAIGICLICLERLLRSWYRYFAYASLARDTDAPSKALSASLIVTVAEVVLASIISYQIFSRATIGRGLNQNGIQESAEAGDVEYYSETDVLKYIGKDQKYLKLAVMALDIKSKTHNGQTLYPKKQIEALKKAQPTEKEFQEKFNKKLRSKGLKVIDVQTEDRSPNEAENSSGPVQEKSIKPESDDADTLEE